jgi:hypothetical protein
MRETLQQAAKKLLTQPAGSEHAIQININDGLTGHPPGLPPRDARTKTTKVKVEHQSRPDGKKRVAVVAQDKGTVLAAATWE